MIWFVGVVVLLIGDDLVCWGCGFVISDDGVYVDVIIDDWVCCLIIS